MPHTNKFTVDDLIRVRENFHLRGETVVAWAREHGFDANLVYQVLSGRCLARRGASHAIAVALGLKPSTALAVRKEVPTSRETIM